MDTLSMAYAKVLSAQIHLLQMKMIEIETDISRGLNSFSVVGLTDKAIEEAKDRVSAAIKNCGLHSPKSLNQRTTVSLAPASIRKEGPHFDLPIALSYLLAVDAIKFDPKDKLFVGELALDGSLRSIKEVLAIVVGAKSFGIKEIFVPKENIKDVSFVFGIKVFPVGHLKEIISHLDKKTIGNKQIDFVVSTPPSFLEKPVEIDMKDIKGQECAKRALEIAAAGGHHVMMCGPPGTGKTMLARAFSSILPELSLEESLEISAIHSSVGASKIIFHPPFRSPHHSASHLSLIGGGAYPKPGEVTLAHKGVLFMDEFPEFDSRTIESLRQPLEDKTVNISRAKTSVVFPADFILIASMNPCPCGFFGSSYKECICRGEQLRKYQRKISGPIIDRIDMWVETTEIDYKKLGPNQDDFKIETTAVIREKVKAAREVQRKRPQGFLNSGITTKDLQKHCPLSDECRKFLDSSSKKTHLSPRAYHRVIKLSRTIADLDGKENIEERHLLEAFQYRPKIKTD